MTARTRVLTRTCVIGLLESVRLMAGPGVVTAQTREHPPRPLAVARSVPAADATGVLPTASIGVTFTRRIDPATLVPATFFLTGPAGTVPGTIGYDAAKRTATLTPASPLRHVANYTVHLTAGVHDRRGQSLLPASWSFESGTDPALARVGFPFSEGMGATSADSSGNGHVARLTGHARWTTNGKYGGSLLLAGGSDGAEVRVDDSFSSRSGLTLEAWILPTSLSGHPAILARQAAGESVDYSIALSGNKGALSARIRTTSDEYVATAPAGSVAAGAWTHLAATYDGVRLRLYRNGLEVASTPASGSIAASPKPLWLGRAADGDSLAGALDEVRIYGRALPAAEIAADMTIPADDITPPEITSTTPAANTPAFDPRLPIVVNVSMALAPASVTSTTVVLRDAANAIVPVSATYQSQQHAIVVTPTAMLAERSTFTVTVSTGVTNSAGVALQNPVAWSFTTADVTPPTVIAVTPSAGTVDVDPAATVSALFSEEVAAATVNVTTVALRDQFGTPVAATVAPASPARSAMLSPTAPLAKGRTYTATLKGGAGGITDTAGNPLARDFSWSFTTHQDLPPQISSLDPASGTPGTTVVISGARFGGEQGSSIVRFNGLAAAVASWSDTSITAAAPPFVTTGDVTVTVGPQVSNGVLFTYSGSGPKVTITYQPHANAAGWYRTPVQAFFTCTDAGAGVQSCPPPITIASEGASQTAAVTATDLSGHYTAVYPTANIDFTPPEISITSPQPGAVLTATTTVVSANVSDVVSGVQSASCNGVAATINGPAVSCSVPVGSGLNPITVRAIDGAGNERSGGVVVFGGGAATALVVTPSHHRLSVGDARTLTVADSVGRPVASALWSTSNPLVAAVDAFGEVTAIAPGDAQITATSGGLSGSASVSVVQGALPAGTPTWSDDPTPGWRQDQSVAIDASAAAFVTTEVRYTAGQIASTQLRAFDDDGHQAALVTAPLAAGERAAQLMGDWGGGALMLIDGFNTRSIVRVPISSDDTATWRAGGLTGYSGNTAQGPDGTVFTIVGQLTSAIGLQVFANQAIVGIDGRDGGQRFGIKPIRPSYGCDPFFGDPDYFVSRFADGITVDTEGYANVIGVVLDRNDQWVTPPAVTCHQGSNNDFYQAGRIVLYRVAPDGTASVIDVYRHASRGGFTFRGPFYTLPDDQGGVLVAWGACDWSTRPPDCRIFARHVDIANGLGNPYELPNDPNIGMVSGSDRTAYFGSLYNTPTRKFDMRTGGVLWSNTVTGLPMAVRADGRVEIQAGSQRKIFDPSAALPTSSPVDLPLIQTAGNTRITGLYGDVRSVVADSFLPDQFGFSMTRFPGAPIGGGLQGRSAAPGHYGIFLKAHNVNVLGVIPVARHASIRITPRNDLWRQGFESVGVTHDPFGYQIVTLGAGPGASHVRWDDTVAICNPTGAPFLTNKVNADSDANIPPSVPLERLRYSPNDETETITRLLTLDSIYQDELLYCFDPGLGGAYYNSNSYAHGLLDAVKIPQPVTPQGPLAGFVGWRKPVPKTEFGLGAD